MNDDVERWLKVVLRDAPANRRDRLQAEILDHLAEATAEHRSRGLDDSAARAAALAALGDPRLTAMALRRVAPQLAPPLTTTPRPRWGVVLVLALLLLAGQALRLPLGVGPESELGQATAAALIVQIVVLTVAASLPLLFDDLDLSLGVAVMLGASLALSPVELLRGLEPPVSPSLLPTSVQYAALVGAGLGLLQGLVVVGLRLPAAAVTLAGSLLTALWLTGRPGINRMTLNSEHRTVMLDSSLLLLAIAWSALCLFTLAAAQAWPPFAPQRSPAPTREERWSDLWRGACLGLPLVLTLAHVRMSWASAPSLLSLALIGAGTALVLVWAYGPADAGARRERVGWLLGVAPVLAGPLMLTMLGPELIFGRGPGYVLGQLAFLLILLLPAALTALAGAVIVRGLWAGRGRAWLWPVRPARRAAWLRVCAFTLGAGLATGVGACVRLQGLRDNTFVHATAFYTLIPLAGVVIGGQHLLPYRLRPMGALLGGLAVAVVTPMGSDNLDSAPEAILLAALLAGLWRLTLPPPRAIAEGIGEPLADPLPVGAKELHRRLELA